MKLSTLVIGDGTVMNEGFHNQCWQALRWGGYRIAGVGAITYDAHALGWCRQGLDTCPSPSPLLYQKKLPPATGSTAL